MIQKIANQSRTVYWLASFCCIIVGSFVLFFGVVYWGSIVTLCGVVLIVIAFILAFLAWRQ
jgi:hypothetical protein